MNYCSRCGSEMGPGGHVCYPEMKPVALMNHQPTESSEEVYAWFREQRDKPTIVEDEVLRHRYMLDHYEDGCEVERFLCGSEWKQHSTDNWLTQLDPHHIFSLGGRWDTPNNLLCITRRAHDYIHFVDSIGGRVACMRAKLSTASDIETVRKEWRKAWGQDAIGWLSKVTIPKPYQEQAEEIKGMFR